MDVCRSRRRKTFRCLDIQLLLAESNFFPLVLPVSTVDVSNLWKRKGHINSDLIWHLATYWIYWRTTYKSDSDLEKKKIWFVDLEFYKKTFFDFATVFFFYDYCTVNPFNFHMLVFLSCTSILWAWWHMTCAWHHHVSTLAKQTKIKNKGMLNLLKRLNILYSQQSL